jgi:hypothetical protein
MIDAAGCGAPLSPSAGALAGVAWDLAAHCMVGSLGGVAPGSRVGGGGRGRGRSFAVQLLPPLCCAEYAPVTAGQTPGVTNQDLRRLEVWLGNCHHLAGVMAGLSFLACCRRPVVEFVTGGSILLGHGMAPGGARYTDCFKGWMNLTSTLKAGA